MNNHQVNQSGTCVIEGCPCRGWSAQERITYVCPNCGKVDEHSDSCPSGPRTSEQPAARGGGDEGEHSPLPWRTGGPYSEFIVSNVGNEPSVARATGLTHKEAEANARFIVKCVNQHQSLVAEREGLRAAIEVAIHNLNAGNDPRFLADYLRLTLDQKRGAR